MVAQFLQRDNVLYSVDTYAAFYLVQDGTPRGVCDAHVSLNHEKHVALLQRAFYKPTG